MPDLVENTEITPEDFDFAKWMSGAYKPTRGSTIHQRGDLLAELDRLREQIEIAAETQHEEESLEDVSTDLLRGKYAKIAQQFHDSGLFVKVSGHTNEEKLSIAKSLDDLINEKYKKDDESEEANEYRHQQSKELTYHLLADALVEPKLDASQLKQLHSVVGESEFSKIVSDYQLASNSLNEPDADFLPKHSTHLETEE
ncbi:hypothetical protein [Glutamicibacter halophytocola]|uniref:hypothetical protein n=1 Tax=Glutamicibacter halophytocola TaxID=1933880 RepID=UPI0015C525A0|nr:hypothetical protein [Glutamicibacter halophytocola]NQD40510.1 hypothetical protein [Glutamicibacter halophytocola]